VPAIAGGLDLAVLCDIRVAAEAATFAYPEIKFGAPVLFGPLRELIGGGLARELCLSGQVHVIFDVVGWYGGSTGGLPPQLAHACPHPGYAIWDRLRGRQDWSRCDHYGGRDEHVWFRRARLRRDGGRFVNTTVTEPTSGSHLTVYPSDTPQPLASNLNFTPGQTVPNLVIVKVGVADGSVKIYNNSGSTHVIFDVVGWYGASGDVFYPITPARVLDTRTGPQGSPPGSVAPDAEITVDVTVGDVPGKASGVVVNTTVTEPTAFSYLSVYPSGVAMPLASNLNPRVRADRPEPGYGEGRRVRRQRDDLQQQRSGPRYLRCCRLLRTIVRAQSTPAQDANLKARGRATGRRSLESVCGLVSTCWG